MNVKPLSIWNPKGGQGKSMISINLAAAAVEIGINPLVVCQDPQGTSTLFSKAGNLPFPVFSEIPERPPEGCQLVIIDHQASDWDLPPCSNVLMPVKPERSQFSTYVDARKRVEKAGKKIITVVTDGNMSRKSEKATVQALRQRGAYEIRSSGAFSTAAEEYRTIFDPALNRVYNINERRKELEAILAAVLDVGNNEKNKEVAKNVEIA